MSLAPPAAKVTTIFNGLSGHAARAGRQVAATPRAAADRRN
jgi:hypothetical protein